MRTGKVTVHCDWCGKEYAVCPSVLKIKEERGYKAQFCSRKCKSEWNKTQSGPWKGKKMPFIKRPNKKIFGEDNPNWRGGRRIDKSGYVLVFTPDHPYRDGDGYVREHRLVIEQSLGRFLSPVEVVHHINGIKNDNRTENLMLMENNIEHQQHEWKLGTYSKIVKYPNFICECGSKKHYGGGYCKKCYNTAWRSKNKEKTKGYNDKSYAKRNTKDT